MGWGPGPLGELDPKVPTDRMRSWSDPIPRSKKQTPKKKQVRRTKPGSMGGGYHIYIYIYVYVYTSLCWCETGESEMEGPRETPPNGCLSFFSKSRGSFHFSFPTDRFKLFVLQWWQFAEVDKADQQVSHNRFPPEIGGE